jgi:hypothetical protein
MTIPVWIEKELYLFWDNEQYSFYKNRVQKLDNQEKITLVAQFGIFHSLEGYIINQLILFSLLIEYPKELKTFLKYKLFKKSISDKLIDLYFIEIKKLKSSSFTQGWKQTWENIDKLLNLNCAFIEKTASEIEKDNRVKKYLYKMQIFLNCLNGVVPANLQRILMKKYNLSIDDIKSYKENNPWYDISIRNMTGFMTKEKCESIVNFMNTSLESQEDLTIELTDTPIFSKKVVNGEMRYKINSESQDIDYKFRDIVYKVKISRFENNYWGEYCIKNIVIDSEEMILEYVTLGDNNQIIDRDEFEFEFDEDEFIYKIEDRYDDEEDKPIFESFKIIEIVDTIKID